MSFAIEVTVVYWYLKGHVAFTNIHTFCFDACAMMPGDFDLVFASCVVVLLLILDRYHSVGPSYPVWFLIPGTIAMLLL